MSAAWIDAALLGRLDIATVLSTLPPFTLESLALALDPSAVRAPGTTKLTLAGFLVFGRMTPWASKFGTEYRC